MVRSQATTMKSRNKNGRTHAAFSAFDTPLSRFGSATSRSLMIVFSREKLTRWINTGKQVFVRQFGLPLSFLRTQEPITTGANCFAGSTTTVSKLRGRGVWVPALARTPGHAG